MTAASAALRHRVVIVGAGFGGLEAARALARAPAEVTVVDKRNFHLFQPLLYQVATAALAPGDIAWPIRGLLSRQRNARALLAEATGVDPGRREVQAGGRAIPYDTLVLATGATHAYFGHAEWETHAPGLKTVSDALELRERMLLAFERAETTADPAARAREQTIAIVGGGATGVELAGAVAGLAHHTLAEEFNAIDPRDTRIVLVEAGPRLLSAFPERLSEKTRGALEARGVEVMTDAAVTGSGPRGIEIGERTIEAATVIWAAGVQASPAARWLGAEADRAGRAQVAPDLSVPGRPEVFVIGDTAAVARPDGRPTPGIAPAAKQMGAHVGRTIAARLAGRPGPGPFRYRHQGDLATIGRNAAIVSVRRLELTGFAGWLFWSVAHILFLIGFRSRLIVGFNWLWSYLTHRRGYRLITRSPAPGSPARADPATGEA